MLLERHTPDDGIRVLLSGLRLGRGAVRGGLPLLRTRLGPLVARAGEPGLVLGTPRLGLPLRSCEF